MATTLDATRTALEKLSIPQLLRISRFAKSCMQSIYFMPDDRDYEDAISEAVLLILSGDRPWNGIRDFERHLLDVIRSVVQEWRATPALDYRSATNSTDPERRLMEQEAWEQIQKLFRYDEPHNRVVHLLAEGMSVGEISTYLQRSEHDVQRLIHDIRVRLQRELPDLCSLAMHLR